MDLLLGLSLLCIMIIYCIDMDVFIRIIESCGYPMNYNYYTPDYVTEPPEIQGPENHEDDDLEEDKEIPKEKHPPLTKGELIFAALCLIRISQYIFSIYVFDW